ncbi:MAG: methionyl-tRNA formyltransferase [Defluviitoga tunisiensis]|jgi:methionyl-tRNA formyltransferase|nr:methionyl-tRNA formyltransferase [Defluviitoga tunisiensis]HOK16979.1 methionyl-tRNA formyltransferase [Defluviitoga tunisiensis]HOL87383.1 methionyl-tRNA formyltransferase [Defluviitoga tunisiensis]HPP10993.1 methionyl-tRNA formyltransferase [Defluviitoga tunisiensis]
MTKKDDFRIVFMGTPEFGGIVLEEIIKNGYNVIGVFSQPDKPKGRGRKVEPTYVKSIALKYGIPVFQPKSVSKGEGFETLVKLNPNIIITAAFGKILRKNVLEYPEKGCWNVHASLLPKYRGAAPIQRAIENGEKETGITIYKMAEALDAGDIAIQKAIPIDINDNLGAVYNKLVELAKEIIIEFLEKFDSLTLVSQDDSLATYAEKITSEDLKVNFNWDAIKVHNKIRAYDPIPGVSCEIRGEIVKLFGSELVENYSKKEEIPYENGTIFDKDNTGIYVKCENGIVKIKEIQFPNKRKITTIDAINGRKLNIGDRFVSA